MKKWIIFTISSSLLLSFSQAWSQTSGSEKSPTQKTVDLLNSPEKRKKAAKKDKASQDAHQKVLDISGSQENTDKIYKLTSMIFQRLAGEQGGDAAKMQTLVDKALKNPEAFADQFTPEERKLLKEIAGSIEKPKSSPK